ncbi:class II fumarate hydratase [Lactiplantibacillus pentosus]|jgi:fumarate hydratase class II|uniref:Fumarate hydratase class II n=2 Tax=Lactiplantibacillus pentosus TaxID=1589 RepID=A0AB37RD08_LACPE|nr:class II fumarate hydratase [Lactiplantibacillus pentosus]MCH4129348.1 class II fumarate hydratase [Lactiplantibacillus sp.]CCC16128.1 fumarate hydratase [Lactiplantibacillus pentosus IG1]BBM20672.1 fumarate hydratase [Lactiplantibacillus plantarum]MCT3285035.1 class II fumarate hydratase [Lactiplantibacillus pentosus]MCT3293364.1 class II fumarate hydratase [Lactiplantibacillus pentosus]
MTEYRVESDTLGEVKIPATALWGAQTERSRHNFPTGTKMPLEIIRALLQIKRAAAIANKEVEAMTAEKADLIVAAIDKLLALDDEDLRKDFPLVVYQTGSGTQTNMNVNEVVAHMAGKLNPDVEILPNDDVNHGQSSNDIFPTAMNITAAVAVDKLIAAAEHLLDELKAKQKKYWRVVKIGRTHLQDATPLTFGQEVSGWASAIEHDIAYLKQLNPTLGELAMGGTAVGTGLNAAPHFAENIAAAMSKLYGIEFTADSNKFYGLAHHSGLNVVHGAIKTLAADLMKIANDVRFLASGPRAGYDELNIPANEPGSSIMPGKVNPTQAEAITMAAVRVMGNDVVVDLASSQGNFEMNVYKTVLIDAFLESAELLAGTITGFADRMIAGLTINEDRMAELVDRSLMTVTALSPHIGYHDSAMIAQQAEKTGTTLREAAIKSGKVTAEQFDEWMVPIDMTNIDN